MDSLKIAVTWFAFGAVIGIAMLLQPIVAPILPKDPGDKLVYVFKRGIAFVGGQAGDVTLADDENGLVVEKLSFSKDFDGREIGFSVDRIVMRNVVLDSIVDLYLGQVPEEPAEKSVRNQVAGSLLIEGLELRTGQDFLHINKIELTNVGADDYHQWIERETLRNGSYASVLAFMVLAGSAETAAADKVFFRNEGKVPVSATVDEIVASELAAGQAGRIEFRNAVAQWKIGNGVAVKSVAVRTFNAREIFSAAAGQDNDLSAPEALIFDLAEFHEFSLHTPDIEILSIPTGKVGSYTQLGRIPVSARLELQKMSVEVDALESSFVREYLSDIGIGALSADVSLAYIFDKNSGLLTIKDGVLSAPDIATVDISAEFSGIKPSWDAIGGFVSGLQESHIVGAKARFEDHSIVKRLGEKWARDTNQRLQDLFAVMTGSTGGAAQGSTKANDAIVALSKFVSAPDALTITMHPAEPVPIEYISDWRSTEAFFETFAIDVVLEQSDDRQKMPN